LELCAKTITLGTHFGFGWTVGEDGPQAINHDFAPQILMMTSFYIESGSRSVLSTIGESNKLGFLLAETKHVEEFRRE
jgi:hypothetical protein